MVELSCGRQLSELRADTYSVSIASLVITKSQRKVLLSVGADAFPASRLVAKREQSDENLIEYIQVRSPQIYR